MFDEAIHIHISPYDNLTENVPVIALSFSDGIDGADISSSRSQAWPIDHLQADVLVTDAVREQVLAWEHIRIEINYLDRQVRQYRWGTVRKTEMRSFHQDAEERWHIRITASHEHHGLFDEKDDCIYYGPQLMDVIQHGYVDRVAAGGFNAYTTEVIHVDDTQALLQQVHPQVAQYQESDGQLVRRIAAAHGLWCFHQHFEKGVKACVTNQNTHFQAIGQLPRIQAGQLDQEAGLHVTKQLAFGDYWGAPHQMITWQHANDMTPDSFRETTLSADPHGVGKLACQVPFPNLSQPAYQQFVATQRLAIAQHQQGIVGELSGYHVSVGDCFEQDGHTWLVEAVSYRFESVSGRADGHYRQFHRIRATCLIEAEYAPAYHPVWHQKVRFAGAMSGCKTHLSDVQADTVMPDADGAIPVRYPMARTVACGSQARLMPIASMNHSQGHGISWPFYRDTLCDVVFDQGDIDRPVIIGTLPCDGQQALMTSSSRRETEMVLPQGQYFRVSHDQGASNRMQLGCLATSGDSELCLSDAESQGFDFYQKTAAHHTQYAGISLTWKIGAHKA